MQRMLLALVLVAAAAWAQEPASEGADPAADDATAEVEETAADTVTDEEVEALLGIDEPYPEDDEDEFVPSEEVKFEQSIPFPTDI
jgi:hypothetical protein